ncbi:MAG: hypothetical protein V7727_17525 [Sneathiella sp.]
MLLGNIGMQGRSRDQQQQIYLMMSCSTRFKLFGLMARTSSNVKNSLPAPQIRFARAQIMTPLLRCGLVFLKVLQTLAQNVVR